MIDTTCTAPVTIGWYCTYKQGHAENNPYLCQARVVRVKLTDEDRRMCRLGIGFIPRIHQTLNDAMPVDLSDLDLGSPEWLSAYRTLRGEGE